jgi:hypothetical protein
MKKLLLVLVFATTACTVRPTVRPCTVIDAWQPGQPDSPANQHLGPAENEPLNLQHSKLVMIPKGNIAHLAFSSEHPVMENAVVIYTGAVDNTLGKRGVSGNSYGLEPLTWPPRAQDSDTSIIISTWVNKEGGWKPSSIRTESYPGGAEIVRVAAEDTGDIGNYRDMIVDVSCEPGGATRR